MLKLLKNLFSLKRFSKPTIISLVLVFVILGMLLPAHSLYSQTPAPWEPVPILKSIITGLGALARGFMGSLIRLVLDPIGSLIIATFVILILISSLFLFMSQSLLNWVMGTGFLDVSFTQNEFVIAGWEIIRDLTNIAIVLGLVAIALATILRISTYHAKKTLPLLLIVALLVNFSPVICGVIIDASNIVMGYFLRAGGLSTALIKTLGEEINALATQNISSTDRLARGLVFVAFNIIGGIIFLLYALLFLFRYIALWILVILSPLAFFCYVFPFTQRWWKAWWNQFFQWCIIGIPAAFSIFLANKIIVLVITQDPAKRIISSPTGALSGFAAVMVFIVPLAFLIGGFLMSLQTGAIGAGIVTGAFDKYVVGGGKKAGKWIERKGWRMAKEVTREPRRRAGGALRKIKTGKEGKEEKEKGHGPKQAGRWAAGWALRPLGRVLEMGAAEEASREIKEAEEKAKGKTVESMAAVIEMGGVSDGIGNLREAIRSKKLRKMRDRGLVNDEKLKRLARATVLERPELFEDIRDVLPGMAGEIGEGMEGKIERFKRMGKYKAAGRLGAMMKRAGIDFPSEDRGKYGTLTEKIRAEAKPAKMELWSKGQMKKALASGTFLRNMTPGQLSQLIKTFESDFFDAWKETGPTEQWLKDYNKPVQKYIDRSPAGAFGLSWGKETPSTALPTTRAAVISTPKEAGLERELKKLESLREEQKRARTREEEARAERAFRKQQERLGRMREKVKREGEKERGRKREIGP